VLNSRLGNRIVTPFNQNSKRMTKMRITRGPSVSKRTQLIVASILFGIVILQAIPIVFAIRGLDRVFRYRQSPAMIAGALLIAGLYIAFSAREPGIRRHLTNFSWLRIPSVLVAITAAIVEEFYFRHMLMDWMQHLGIGATWQVLTSGLSFGIFHAIWGVWGGWRVVVGAVTATSALGFALAILYLISGRHLVACIEAHFLVDLFLEPALVIFAVESGARKKTHNSR
jgi:hypothetical protein